MRFALVLAAVLIVASCAPVPVVTPPQVPQGPATAEANDGPYRLTFELPKSTWSVAEAIEGQSTLSLTEGAVAKLGGSGGGLLAFAFREVGGTRRIDPVWTADCAQHTLASDVPITSGLTKSGGWSANDPNAGFYQQFLAGHPVHLPAGEWDLVASAEFVEGVGCAGRQVSLEAPIRILVTP